jgi:hypothetical protein
MARRQTYTASHDVLMRMQFASTPRTFRQSHHAIGEAVASTKIKLKTRKEIAMLYTIAVVLVILWLLGLVSSYTIGGFIHILLVIAIVIVLLRVISGRKPL